MKQFLGRGFLSLGFLAVAFAMPARAVPVNWVPDADGSWHDAVNWNPGIPGFPDDVTIDVGGAVVRTITYSTGSSLIASLTSSENVAFTGGQLVTGGATTIRNGTTLSADGPSTSYEGVDMAGLSVIDGANLRATDGGRVQLDSATSYTVPDSGNFAVRTLEATGGGLLSLAGVNSVEQNSNNIGVYTDIRATSGGRVDLSSATLISSSAGGVFNFPRGQRISANGAGSIIDLTSLTTFENLQGFEGAQSNLFVNNGGQVLTPALTTIRRIRDITVSGMGSTLDLSGVTSFTQSGITVDNGATIDLSAVADATGSSFIVNNGAQIVMPDVTTYESANGRFAGTNWLALGRSTLSLPNLTSYTHSSGVGQVAEIRASGGGLVSLNALETIRAENGLINSERPIGITADGNRSRVLLNNLREFSDLASNPSSAIFATGGGQVSLFSGSSAPVALTNISVSVGDFSVIRTNEIELISQATPTSGNPLNDRASLEGSGTVNGSVLNTSGFVNPGGFVDTLTIIGNYSQGPAGTLTIDLFDDTNFDVLNIHLNASFDGTLEVLLDSSFDLSATSEFLVGDIGLNSTGTFAGLPQGAVVLSDNGFDLYVDYRGGDGNDLVLTTTRPIPEPAALLLLGTAAMFFGCRRKSA